MEIRDGPAAVSRKGQTGWLGELFADCDRLGLQECPFLVEVPLSGVGSDEKAEGNSDATSQKTYQTW